MGVLDAFVIGAVAGGAGAALLFVVLARGAGGRSSTAFVLPGWTAANVLGTAHAYLLQRGVRVRPIAGGVTAEEGSAWMTGVRVLQLRARDRGDGDVDVRIDAYIRGFYPKEIHLDPMSYFAMIPRRKALALARGLASAIGAPFAAWTHRRS